MHRYYCNDPYIYVSWLHSQQERLLCAFFMLDCPVADVLLTDVSKLYGEQHALHGVSLDIKDGEFAVFVGPSGCGKSTLLRIIAGLESISSGTVSIGGNDVSHVAPSERDVAMVFQSYALYPHMSVQENMAFGMKVNGVPTEERNERVLEAARTLQLEPLLERKPAQLSGGQRQRVAIGRAIVKKPKVFLFDEPLSNLDAKLRIQMRVELEALHRQLGATMIYVTHDQVEAMTMADRIVVLNDGAIEQLGRPLELYRTPESEFVADFLGSPSMNFFDVTTQNGQLFLHDFPVAGVDPGSDVVKVGIRPEHILLEEPGRGTLEVVIEVKETLGGEAYLYTRHLPTGTALVVKADGEDPHEVEQNVGLVLPSARLHRFGRDKRAIQDSHGPA